MSVAKNYMYNVLYQLLTLLIPLITVPYVSRILGAEGVGINAYTFSIVQYFVLFGMIGVNLYGNRTIATVRDDSVKLNTKFWTIYTLQLITCIASIIFYFSFLNIFISENKSIYFVQSLYLIAAAIDISWLFMGLEQFKKTVTRNMIVKILGVICIFIFIRNKDDLILYAIILGASNVIGQLVMWGQLKNIIDFKYIRLISTKDILSNLKPAIILFIPQIAVQIYTVLNKTMLGLMTTNIDVGIYENSEKIVKITLAIATSLGVVMLPRISNEYAKGQMEKVNNYIYKSIKFVSFISFPIMFGIAAISKEFAPWFFGKDFYKCSYIIPLISPIIVLIAWSNVLGVQYMLPTGKNKEFTMSVTLGAIVNLVANLFLIKKFQAAGAAISTVIAELSVTAIQMYILRKDLEVNVVIPEIIKYLISGVLMCIVVRVVGNILGVSITTTMLQIIIGGLIYLIALVVLKSSILSETITILKQKVSPTQ